MVLPHRPPAPCPLPPPPRDCAAARDSYVPLLPAAANLSPKHACADRHAYSSEPRSWWHIPRSAPRHSYCSQPGSILLAGCEQHAPGLRGIRRRIVAGHRHGGQRERIRFRTHMHPYKNSDIPMSQEDEWVHQSVVRSEATPLSRSILQSLDAQQEGSVDVACIFAWCNEGDNVPDGIQVRCPPIEPH